MIKRSYPDFLRNYFGLQIYVYFWHCAIWHCARDAEVSIALGSEHRPKAVFLARQGFSGCFEKKI